MAWLDSTGRVRFADQTATFLLAMRAGHDLDQRLRDALSGARTVTTSPAAGIPAVVRNEVRLQQSDGIERLVQLLLAPNFDLDGRPSGTILLVRDLSEDTGLERQGRVLRERLRLIMDSLPAFIVYFDRQLRFQMVNRTAAAWLARPESELIGRTLLSIASPESVDARTLAGWEAALAGRSTREEIAWGFPDGKLRHCEAIRVPDFDESGSVRGICNLLLDMSDRHEALARLEASEARFSAFMEATPAAAWIKDAGRRYVYMNRTWSLITGLNRDEWLGRPTRPNPIAETAAASRETDLDVILTGRPNTGLATTLARDGTTTVWQRHKFPMRDVDGRPLVGTIAIDLTEQKRLEHKLHEALTDMQLVVEAGQVGLWDWNLATHAVRFSAEWKRQIGYAPDELPEGYEVWCERLHPDDRTRTEAAVLAYIAGNSDRYRTEFRLRHKNGSYRWILATGQLVRDEGGTPVRIRGTHVDVTQLKLTELSLESTLSQYRLVAENIPAMLVHVGADLRYRFANRVACQWLARPASEIVGRLIVDVVPAARRGHALETAARVLSGETVRTQAFIEYPDGVGRWCDFTRVPDRAADGTVRGYFTVGIDVSERRSAEDRLRQAQKMEAIGQLTGGIAHDFNNLLMVISGNLKLAVSGGPIERRFVDTAFAAAERGASLGRRLLSFARRMPLHPIATDINGLVRNAAGLFERALGEDIATEMALMPEPVWIRIDPHQLESALLNLVVNARDAMSGGGKLTVRTGPAAPVVLTDLGIADEHVWVCLSVTDTGVGMAPGVRERACEPFFTTKPVGRGSGLGLSMVYGFAEQSGGRMAIDSAIGQGTTVSLYFPVVPPPDGHAADVVAIERTTPVVPGRGRHVLVVEDDGEVRDIVAAQLRALGHSVTAIADGPAALRQLATAEQIDCLLTDIVLPGGLSGLDVARRARLTRPGLTVVFMSGHARQHEAELDADASLIVLRKPFSQEQLAAAIARPIGRHSD